MIPYHERDFDLKGFTGYLEAQGADLLKPTNPYEVVRYKAHATAGGRVATHIIYRKATGKLTYTGWSNKHYKDFQRGWNIGQLPPQQIPDGIPKRVGKLSKPRRDNKRARIMERDGTDCWYCKLPLGEDRTIEHLVSKSTRGGNEMENLVLAHGTCNKMAENKPLAEKIILRDELSKQAADGRFEP